MNSPVYYFPFQAGSRTSRLDSLKRLMKSAGFENIDFKGKFVAIKLHVGEYGNLAFIRPNYIKVVADYIKELGGKPFLTDCNTLYIGSRTNGIDHIETAYLNGFSPLQTGCHFIVGDGLRGTDEELVPVKNGEYIKEARIGKAIMDADIVISVSHFKGHEVAGFGGAIKNLGMGSGSRAGKMEQHAAGKPYVFRKKCIGCGACTRICAHDAPKVTDGKCTIDEGKCVGCGRCLAMCPTSAILVKNWNAGNLLNYKMAEYSMAVCQDRPNFHISFITDVSPDCDCTAANGKPIIPDLGILASFDPVAIDQACVDLVNKAPIAGGSELGIAREKEGDDFESLHNEENCLCGHAHDGEHEYFHMVHPDTGWESALDHGVKIGLGSREYELITL